MRAIDRKLLRDLLKMKGQVVAIALIIACGISSWICVLIAYRSLRETRDDYYREYRMADVFAPVKRAPLSITDRLERIPGVRRVRGGPPSGVPTVASTTWCRSTPGARLVMNSWRGTIARNPPCPSTPAPV